MILIKYVFKLINFIFFTLFWLILISNINKKFDINKIYK